MTKYETMLVTSAKLDEEATQKLVGKFKSVIEANGTIEAVDEWGKRRLAYPINKEEEGIYTLIYFESGPDFPTELERRYRITDGVLRSMIIARPEGAPLPQPKEAPKAEAPAAAPVAQEVKAEEAPAPAEEATPAEEPKAEEAPAPVEEAPAAEAEAPAEEPAAAPAEEAKAEPEQEA